MRRFADADHGRDNNFNLMRMIAASAVLVSHAWPLTMTRAVSEPLLEQTGYSLGIACVVVFFAISGYFITKSFDRRAVFADFALARVSRIFPGLAVALLLTAFVIGPAFSALSSSVYFARWETWAYVPQNLMLAHLRFGLPGVWESAPFSGVTNGSLWTLKYEVGCYAGVVICGYLGLLRPKLYPLVLAVAVAAMVVVPGGDMALSARVAVLCGAFAIGAGCYVYRAQVPISGLLAIGLVVLAVVTHGTRVYPVFYAAALGYPALAFGFADLPALRAYNRLGDYSYGMYIYAFPIGQALVATIPGLTPWRLVALNAPLALACAILSWRLVEGPALAHRHRLAALLRLDRFRRAPGLPIDGAQPISGERR